MKIFTLLFGLALPLIATAQTTIPYTQAFDRQEDFNSFTIVDANGDANTWLYDGWDYQATCLRNPNAAADDWLITPMFHFTAGVTYELKFKAKSVYDGTTENFLVMLGTSSADISTFTKTIIADGSVNKSYPATEFSTTFTVEADGDYYLGFHYLTSQQSFSSGLSIDDISLTGNAPVEKVVPMPVSGVTLAYDYTQNRTTLRWQAPTQFTNGTAITTAPTYTVRRVRETTNLIEDYPSRVYREEVTVNTLPSNNILFGQAILRYAITAKSDGETSAVAYSPIKVIGTPDELPYAESFANGALHKFWGETHSGVGRWGEMSVNNDYAQDGDKGIFNFTAVAAGDNSQGFSGLIKLGNATNPVLSFWYEYMTLNDNDVFEVQVAVDGGDFTKVKDIDINNIDNMKKWTQVEVPLKAYLNSNFIQVAFFVKSESGNTVIYIDNVKVYNKVSKDLAISTVKIPSRLRTDEQRNATLKVENIGIEDIAAGSYQIAVMADDKEIGRTEGVALTSGSSVEVTVALKAPATVTTDSVSCRAQLIFADDNNTVNNSTESIRLKVSSPGYPNPTNLTALAEGTNVTLSWQKPDSPRATSTPVTDSFEDAPDFTISDWGEWTLYDGNQSSVYGIDGATFPNNGKAQAFIVFNRAAAGVANAWNAHTGNKNLVSFSQPSADSDHWLISPTLSGEAQTVTFYARPISGKYPERFDFAYSTTSVEPTSFISLATVTTGTDFSWKEYSYDVPAGARYFAIHATSNDAYALLLDDFIFIPDTTGRQNIVLTGYDVYRDGVKITSAPVASTTFTDEASGGDHVYNVSAVYDKGESMISNPASVNVVNGISSIVETKTSNSAYYDLQGRKVTRPAHPGIYIHNGKRIVVK